MSTPTSKAGLNAAGMPSSLPVSEDVSLTMVTAQNIDAFAPAIVKHINGDPDVRATFHMIRFAATEAQVKDIITSDPDEGVYDYAFTSEGKALGLIGMALHRGSDLGKELVISYSIDKDHRRRGLVSRGVELLIDEASKIIRPDYFSFLISDDNPRSQGVAEKIGFQRTESMFTTDSGKIERRYVRKRR